jgi:hypothetical protein
MRHINTPGLKKNWLRVATFCLISGCGSALAQDPPGQKATEPRNSLQEQRSSNQTDKSGFSSGLSRAEMEQFLFTARVLQRKELSRGITNSERATLDDGKLRHDAHIQTVEISKISFQTVRGTEFNFRDSYKYNMAAYELDKLLELNMVPVSVERKVGGQMAAVTWWVDDVVVTELERKKKKMEPPDLKNWNQQMYVLRVFDQLIYNTDRNLGNVLVTKDWKIWMIDHTRAFRMRKDLENPKNLVQCDRQLLAKLRSLDKNVLNQKLGRYLTGAEIDGLLSRRDKIVKFFDEQVAQKGEAAVLFDLVR